MKKPLLLMQKGESSLPEVCEWGQAAKTIIPDQIWGIQNITRYISTSQRSSHPLDDIEHVCEVAISCN